MARVQVLMTPGCAKCPETEEVVDEVVAEFDGVDWEEVDISEDPGRGTELGVLSVPAVVVDGEVFGTGVPDRDELRDRVQQVAG